MPGAMIGIAMKTMKASDITDAISRPEKRSRITDMATTRVAAAPRPCTKRRPSRIAKVGAKVAAKAQTTIEHDAEEQRRAAAEAVGDRAEDELRRAEADHVGRDHELPLVLVGDAERLRPCRAGPAA